VFYIDGASVLYLIGSTMDWQEDDFAAGFVFANPTPRAPVAAGRALRYNVRMASGDLERNLRPYRA
jgi:Fe-S cluster assembly iron-binding protein IscA